MTALEGAESKPVLVYAGSMFDVKGRNDVEIRELGFNTYLTREMDVALYVREGGYEVRAVRVCAVLDFGGERAVILLQNVHKA